MIQYDEPTVIVGTTKHGKSYFAKKTLKQQRPGVLFYNTLRDNADMADWLKCDGEYSFRQLFDALKKGYKLNYQAHINRNILGMELELIFDKMMRMHGSEYIFALDEVHLFYDNKKIDSYLKDVSQTGRHFGITPVWVTQRPQQLPRPCITQANQVIFFNMNFEDSWLKEYGINAEQLRQKIQGRKYYFCRWTPGGGLEDAVKI
ncbi:MAG: AAA-like domain protein [Bacteroidetes bacterium ADurb.Bin408]|nr:MAG: AAA-like domain protein [Bacteroidetes bacterium ADurb.Bin408]